MLEHITAEDIARYGVVAAPDRLDGRAQDNKAVFDRLVREMVAVVVNRVIDEANALEAAEEPRAAAEVQRVEQEAGRLRAEGLRVAAETARALAEDGRTGAEQVRVDAESARGGNEEARKDAETGRVSAEDARVAAEALRVATDTGIVARATAQAERAETAAGSAQENRLAAQGAAVESGQHSAISLRAQEETDTSRAAAAGSEQEATRQAAEAGMARDAALGYAKQAEAGADRAQRVAVNTPYLSTAGRWMVWDDASDAYLDSGVEGRGPVGPAGMQGPAGADGLHGAQGPQGVAGTVVEATGFYGFEVSEHGMLTLVCMDDAQPPHIELGADGHLYLTVE